MSQNPFYGKNISQVMGTELLASKNDFWLDISIKCLYFQQNCAKLTLKSKRYCNSIDLNGWLCHNVPLRGWDGCWTQ
jgi:hypothetical protein